MSSKSYVRLVVPEGDRQGLMRWVAILTGSKNTLKGVGFFVGGALLGAIGFRWACYGMAIAVAAALVGSVATLPQAMGKAKARVGLRSVISRDPRINWLSAARLFLFGARDVWFVLALPIFLRDSLGWTFSQVGAFLALWVIGYGIVQAAAPAHLRRRSGHGGPPDASQLVRWTLALLVPLGAMIGALAAGLSASATLISGLALFGIVFATNSAIHSFLIVHYAEQDKVALAVGFYYMANAAGRLVGTLLSGALFQWFGLGQSGLVASLACSMLFVGASAVACEPLRRAERRIDAAGIAGA
jgi:predicted MFS family arabinose efflux permease